ncbi:hypothetical protein [Pseudomonas veronii]|jgi:hypothetical protein|nr:hypothetical protein [Pseudomonas veronii]
MVRNSTRRMGNDREHLHRPQQSRETQVDFVKLDPMTIECELTVGPPQIRQLD